MGQPKWKQLAEVLVPASDGYRWTRALEYLTPGRLYQIRVPKTETSARDALNKAVEMDQKWEPDATSGSPCSGDGHPEISRAGGTLPMPDTYIGALIAKIGGGSADGAGDKDRTVLLSVGRHCVFQAPESPKAGSLFLGVNDTPSNAVKLKGQLKVVVEEAL